MKNVGDEDLMRVTPSSLQAYLERHEHEGWHATGTMAGGVGTFYELSGGRNVVLVPASAKFADYPVRMAENIAVLSNHEDRPAEQVLRDLLAIHEDIIRVSIDASTTDASLSLADGASPGGRGQLPTRGSHGSGRAPFGHPAPQIMVSLLNGTHCARRAQGGGDRC